MDEFYADRGSIFGQRTTRRMTCAEQFRVMAFAQLTWRESLRDIEVTLSANTNRLYSMGLRHAIHRSTLADANESRDWRIWCRLRRKTLATMLDPRAQLNTGIRGHLR